ncbi:MAG TPA: hypothetical protein VFV89_19655 [Nocardioides sp.]|uniref:hypothetical protein n=1 Tax=Nocardioides sp. TaxID=35761 RepID=UPI002E355909|nr:hypothetical protein [Nocardioides sp.]HEX5090034.1 hypothetical protein [Nocardioides sp.]
MATTRMRLTATVLVLVAAATAGTVTAAVTSGDRRPAATEAATSAPDAVDVLLVDCGSGWTPGPCSTSSTAGRSSCC